MSFEKSVEIRGDCGFRQRGEGMLVPRGFELLHATRSNGRISVAMRKFGRSVGIRWGRRRGAIEIEGDDPALGIDSNSGDADGDGIQQTIEIVGGLFLIGHYEAEFLSYVRVAQGQVFESDLQALKLTRQVGGMLNNGAL